MADSDRTRATARRAKTRCGVGDWRRQEARRDSSSIPRTLRRRLQHSSRSTAMPACSIAGAVPGAARSTARSARPRCRSRAASSRASPFTIRAARRSPCRTTAPRQPTCSTRTPASRSSRMPLRFRPTPSTWDSTCAAPCRHSSGPTCSWTGTRGGCGNARAWRSSTTPRRRPRPWCVSGPRLNRSGRGAPTEGRLTDRVLAAFAHARTGAPNTTGARPVDPLAQAVLAAIPEELRPSSPPARPPAAISDVAHKHFLAAHAFANWTAHLGRGLRTWLRSIEAADALLTSGVDRRRGRSAGSGTSPSRTSWRRFSRGRKARDRTRAVRGPSGLLLVRDERPRTVA